MYSRVISLPKLGNRAWAPRTAGGHCDQGGPRNCVQMCPFGGCREGDLERHRKSPLLASKSVKEGHLQYHSTSVAVVSVLRDIVFTFLNVLHNFLPIISKHAVSNILILSLGYSTSWKTWSAFMLLINAVVFFPGPVFYFAGFSVCGRAVLSIKKYNSKNTLLKYNNRNNTEYNNVIII